MIKYEEEIQNNGLGDFEPKTWVRGPTGVFCEQEDVPL